MADADGSALGSTEAGDRSDGAWRRPLRYAYRLPLLVLHLLLGLPITLLLINPLCTRLRIGGESVDHRAIRWWSRTLVRIFGMRARRVGKALPGGVLCVANHVSWIDIEVIHAVRVVGFVAKSEISRWPLIGWLAKRGGTIYHRRGSNASLADVKEQMVERLRSGFGVGVFPEGGTSDGFHIRTFHARIFQAAVESPAPVQPVALEFGEGASAQHIVAFGKDESFMASFWRLLGEPTRRVQVHFLEPIPVGFEDGRRAMAEICRSRIVKALYGSEHAESP